MCPGNFFSCTCGLIYLQTEPCLSHKSSSWFVKFTVRPEMMNMFLIFVIPKSAPLEIPKFFIFKYQYKMINHILERQKISALTIQSFSLLKLYTYFSCISIPKNLAKDKSEFVEHKKKQLNFKNKKIVLVITYLCSECFRF